MADKFQHIKVPILNDEYYVVVCWGNLEQAMKFISKHTKNAADFCGIDNNRGICFFNTALTFMPIIYMNLKVKHKRFFGTLSHEACHAINAMWEYIGEESRKEIFAYSVGAIVAAVEREVKK